MQEYRLPDGAKIRSREDGQVYTVHSSNQTNNQFGYGVYFYRVKERLQDGFGLYWNWFDVVDEKQIIELLIKERDKFKECTEWYADPKTYQLGVQITMGSATPMHEPIKYDKGDRARATLSTEGQG